MAHILIVDDEFGIARLLEEVLQDEGHTVAVASNGRQGFERAQIETPDVVLTDLMMPIMDGPALLSAIRADEKLAEVPVILMSAVSEESAADRCSGYTEFVRKPFKLFHVVDLVRHLLTSRHDK